VRNEGGDADPPPPRDAHVVPPEFGRRRKGRECRRVADGRATGVAAVTAGPGAARLGAGYCPQFRSALNGVWAVGLVHVGLAETKNLAEGYEAIFGKKKDEKNPEAARPEEAKKEEPKEEKK